ncbi:hypothetical protein BJ684DRAFT_19304 [Piptocephalis cylindrospora]|uniref:Transmembrane protein n=1 Tax=Piptocephalis cylindrospora TaxID=1907219 RepID=A0A4P9Y5M1_9FUNG|nr:hypothetical protein BJ684DRAFT_19304 [Piptocephalis cylindrospora]|eukprot:RKP14277.1 hypothetical protein BJ684DRAFT_19304 [Piptocephalis cylindrospora]
MGLPTSLFSSGSSTSSTGSHRALTSNSAFFPTSRRPARGRQGMVRGRVIREEEDEEEGDSDDDMDDLSNVPLHDDSRPSTPGIHRYRSLRQRYRRAQRHSRPWRARGLFLALFAESWAWALALPLVHQTPLPDHPDSTLHILAIMLGLYALSAWLTHVCTSALAGVGGGWVRVQASRILMRTRAWKGQWLSHSSLFLLPTSLSLILLLAMPLLALVAILLLRLPRMATSPPHPSTASLLPGGGVGGAVAPEVSIREDRRGRQSMLSAGDDDEEDDEDEGEYWEAVPGYTISGGGGLEGSAFRGGSSLGDDWWRWWWDGRLRGAAFALFTIHLILTALIIGFLSPPSDQDQGRLDGMALGAGWIMSLGLAQRLGRKRLHEEGEAAWVVRSVGLGLLGILIPASLLLFPPASFLRILSSSTSQAIGSGLIGAALGTSVAPGADEAWRWAQDLGSAWAEWEGSRLGEWLVMWSLAGLILGPLLPYLLSLISSLAMDTLAWSTAAIALTMAALTTVFNRAGWLYHDGYELIV